jgi:hypothetical protein
VEDEGAVRFSDDIRIAFSPSSNEEEEGGMEWDVVASNRGHVLHPHYPIAVQLCPPFHLVVFHWPKGGAAERSVLRLALEHGHGDLGGLQFAPDGKTLFSVSLGVIGQTGRDPLMRHVLPAVHQWSWFSIETALNAGEGEEDTLQPTSSFVLHFRPPPTVQASPTADAGQAVMRVLTTAHLHINACGNFVSVWEEWCCKNQESDLQTVQRVTVRSQESSFCVLHAESGNGGWTLQAIVNIRSGSYAPPALPSDLRVPSFQTWNSLPSDVGLSTKLSLSHGDAIRMCLLNNVMVVVCAHDIQLWDVGPTSHWKSSTWNKGKRGGSIPPVERWGTPDVKLLFEEWDVLREHHLRAQVGGARPGRHAAAVTWICTAACECVASSSVYALIKSYRKTRRAGLGTKAGAAEVSSFLVRFNLQVDADNGDSGIRFDATAVANTQDFVSAPAKQLGALLAMTVRGASVQPEMSAVVPRVTALHVYADTGAVILGTDHGFLIMVSGSTFRMQSWVPLLFLRKHLAYHESALQIHARTNPDVGNYANHASEDNDGADDASMCVQTVCASYCIMSRSMQVQIHLANGQRAIFSVDPSGKVSVVILSPYSIRCNYPHTPHPPLRSPLMATHYTTLLTST